MFFSPLLCIIFLHFAAPSPSPASALDFLFNSFTAADAPPNITLTDDAHIDPPVIRLTIDPIHHSWGRAFYPFRIPFKDANSTAVTTSFSTQFVFSIVPAIASSPQFGFAFVLSQTTSPTMKLAGQYFGLFTASEPSVAPLLAIEFDTGWNPELNDRPEDHIGVNLNNPVSATSEIAGYYSDTSNSSFIPVSIGNGQNIQAWIEFNGPQNEINVTIAPAGMPRPARPVLTYRDPQIADYIGPEMFVGFSASKFLWVEAQRVLAWSFSDIGIARDINTTGFPVFKNGTSSSSSLSSGTIAVIVVACVLVIAVVCGLAYWFWWIRRKKLEEEEEDEIEDWEMEYWPHRYSYEELSLATKGFLDKELLGFGGFGKVYKGTLANNMEVAIKCVNHDSKQGLREFMAEISSMGRLQHKNLVQLRGWCRKGSQLMLVYDYMPNSSLNKWIFDEPEKLMNWEGRKRVLADVAEGLSYLHHYWEQVVLHRDIKSSNILLDGDMRGRLGDFGLAKMHAHGEVPGRTRVVGTWGYMAPEVVTLAVPTAASDVYSFGIVMMEVVCGRRPLDCGAGEDGEILTDLVRQKFLEGRLCELTDKRMNGECEMDEMEWILKLGLCCCHPNPLGRPTMKEIAAALLGGRVAMVPRDLLSEMTQEGSFSEGPLPEEQV